MSIPTGAGTEVLKRVTLHDNNASQTEILSGSADHIYTILSIIFCDQQGAANTIKIIANNGSADIALLHDSPVPSFGTFVWSDKFILYEDDDLDVSNSGTKGDWWVTYIDQHF
tara:strand:- start:715 stop:1053 length:339 start_codon:yes stop_codon:yes gene_type:complete